MFCKYCGNELYEGDTQCPNCGKNVNDNNKPIINLPRNIICSLLSIIFYVSDVFYLCVISQEPEATNEHVIIFLVLIMLGVIFTVLGVAYTNGWKKKILAFLGIIALSIIMSIFVASCYVYTQIIIPSFVVVLVFAVFYYIDNNVTKTKIIQKNLKKTLYALVFVVCIVVAWNKDALSYVLFGNEGISKAAETAVEEESTFSVEEKVALAACQNFVPRLKDPDSFEAYDIRVTLANPDEQKDWSPEDKTYYVCIGYRAKNSFGGKDMDEIIIIVKDYTVEDGYWLLADLEKTYDVIKLDFIKRATEDYTSVDADKINENINTDLDSINVG